MALCNARFAPRADSASSRSGPCFLHLRLVNSLQSLPYYVCSELDSWLVVN
jgi:hypothetical protein